MKKKNHGEKIKKAQIENQRFFSPTIFYNEDYDILSIIWCPQHKVKESIETKNGFVFDLDSQNRVKGLEIFDFKKKLNDIK